MPPPGAKSTDGDILTALLGEIGRKATGWRALVVSLSRLPVGEKRTVLSRRLAKEMKDSAFSPQGSLVLPNSDVLALVRDPEGRAMIPLLSIASTVLTEADVHAPPLIHQFDLATQTSQFLAQLSGVNEKATKPTAVDHVPLPWKETELGVMPKDIAKVEKMFYRANVENFVRNQFAYRLISDWELDEDHDEVFISIDYLKQYANEQISADRWLFQYFTRTLDNRLLKVMGGHNEGQKKEVAYSLNLNISSLLSEDFLEYDALLSPRVRKGQIIEVQGFDLVENASMMRFLSGFLHSRGYRLCADGITREMFMVLDWDRMNVDMVKLRWAPDFTSAENAAFRGKVTGLVAAGSPQLVLCWCGDDAAVDWGIAIGIKVFQGWYLDGLRKVTPDQPPPRYRLRPRR
ncbi:MAG: hypothetical protein H7840_08225 [Alphaproteobacteria bacterium]